MYKHYNCNPCKKRVGDCTVRAISKVLEQSWEQTYIELAIYGFMHCDMPSSNAVWGAYLRSKGYQRFIIPDDYDDYTVSDFCEDYPNGKYLLALQSHVVASINGDFFDTWHSGDEPVIYFWAKRKENDI